MKAALLMGPTASVRSWEYEALRLAVKSGMEITTVLHCTNEGRPRLQPKHAGYYALALAGRRSPAMRPGGDITPLLAQDVRTLRFESEWEGHWQRIPAEIVEQLEDVDVVIKFGMNFLRDPEEIPATFGVLAYHHGDPEKYRGHPAGFYELETGEAVMGIIVEQLSNAPDEGRILAKAHAKVIPTSYAATLNNALTTGTPLLAQALEALKSSDGLSKMTLGAQELVPTNRQILGSLAKTTSARVKRLMYGAFREKRWNIAFVPEKFDPESGQAPHYSELQSIRMPAGYTFAADPCAHHNGQLYAEVMHAGTGKGEIFAYAEGTWSQVELPVGGRHVSYPQIVEDAGVAYLFPEMADAGPPSLFELDETGLKCVAVHRLTGLGDARLVDGTMFQHEDHWYLFASRPETANERLDLWVADRPVGPWSLHPKSPVCLDPRSARMGGPVVRAYGRMYRIGQNGSVGYGQGVTIMRIEKLSVEEYRETAVGPFEIRGAYGPHTILPTAHGYWLDYYTEKTTPMAGIRRVKGLTK